MRPENSLCQPVLLSGINRPDLSTVRKPFLACSGFFGMADRICPHIMTSRFLRAACASVICLLANVGEFNAQTPSSQSQIDATRRQYLQALQRGDINAAERYERELRALEARSTPVLGTAAPTASSAAGSTFATPSSSGGFFSAPGGRTVSAPAETSAVFNAPAVPSSGFAAPTFSAPAARPVVPASSPAPAFPPTPRAASGLAPAATSPGVATSSTTFPTARTATPFSGAVPAVTPSVGEEPRPAELPPGVLDAKEANAVLSKLEEFRMAESQASRRSTSLAPEPARPSAERGTRNAEPGIRNPDAGAVPSSEFRVRLPPPAWLLR